MSSDNDASSLLTSSDGGMNENSTDQDSVESCSDRLVLSNDFIDLDSIGNPLVDGLVDQPQQEKWAGGLNLAVESEILDSEFLALKTPSSILELLVKRGGLTLSPRADPSPITWYTISVPFFSHLTLKRLVR